MKKMIPKEKIARHEPLRRRKFEFLKKIVQKLKCDGAYWEDNENQIDMIQKGKHEKVS
jgi:hypothetical protein